MQLFFVKTRVNVRSLHKGSFMRAFFYFANFSKHLIKATALFPHYNWRQWLPPRETSHIPCNQSLLTDLALLAASFESPKSVNVRTTHKEREVNELQQRSLKMATALGSQKNPVFIPFSFALSPSLVLICCRTSFERDTENKERERETSKKLERKRDTVANSRPG
jgi:hypothetical protein